MIMHDGWLALTVTDLLNGEKETSPAIESYGDSTGRLPVELPAFLLAARLEWTPDEAGEHDLSIHVVNDSGTVIEELESRTWTFVSPAPGELGHELIILDINDLMIPWFGTYALRIDVDGRSIGSVPLIVGWSTAPGETIE